MKIINKWSITNLFDGARGICYLCRADGLRGIDICAHCYRDLERLSHACSRCANPLSPSVLAPVCGQCQAESPSFESTIATFLYHFPVDKLIQRLKFDGDLTVARLLGQLSARAIQKQTETYPQAIIPVPLHASRFKQRGFNQSNEIARTIAKTLQLPLLQKICERTKATVEQSSLHAKRRKQNVKNAFAITGQITAEHVAIVDDVMTTGNTCNAMAKALKRAGVKRVDVWVCARA